MNYYENTHDKAVAQVICLQERKELIERLERKYFDLEAEHKSLLGKMEREMMDRSFFEAIFCQNKKSKYADRERAIFYMMVDVGTAILTLKTGEPMSEESMKFCKSL